MKAVILYFFLSVLLFGNTDNVNTRPNQFSKNVFIENIGQWPSEVKYLARAGGMNAWITNNGVVYDYFQVKRNYNEPMSP